MERFVGTGDAVRTLRHAHGLDLSAYNPTFVGRVLEERRQTRGCTTTAEYVEELAHDAPEAESLSRSLHVTYTEFARNPLTFAVLEEFVLPALAAEADRTGRTTIRVWSAGCATGQEAWSVALLLDDLTSRAGIQTGYRVIATDISENDLAFARKGVYSTAAVANLRMGHLATHFVRHGDHYSVADRLRARVEFSCYDLRDAETAHPPESVFGDFDLVLCCNLLLYYRPRIQRQMLEKLRTSLRERGYLAVGEAERQIVKRTAAFRDVVPPAPIFQVVRS